MARPQSSSNLTTTHPEPHSLGGVRLDDALNLERIVSGNLERVREERTSRGRAVDYADWDQRLVDGYAILAKALTHRDEHTAVQWAVESVESTRRRFSDRPEVQKLAGIARMCEGNYTGAAGSFLNAATWKPDAESSFLLGASLFYAGHFDRAVMPLKYSLKQQRDGLTHYFLGLSLFEGERNDLALREFSKGLTLIKGKPGYHDLRMQMHYFSGMINVLEEKSNNAVEHLRKGKDASTYGQFWLGEAYAELGKKKLASSGYRGALQAITRTSPAKRSPMDWEYLLNAVDGLVVLGVPGADRSQRGYQSQAKHYLEIAAK